MKNLNTIIKNIESDKELVKGLKKVSFYETERFIEDAKSYIKAIKEGRMINSIGSVSSSGMSRTIKFLSCEKSNSKSGQKFYYRNYFAFFKALGYSETNKRDHYFRISGCGMDMVFHTNYSNIHKLGRLGFLNKAEVSRLAQETPQTI